MVNFKQARVIFLVLACLGVSDSAEKTEVLFNVVDPEGTLKSSSDVVQKEGRGLKASGIY